MYWKKDLKTILMNHQWLGLWCLMPLSILFQLYRGAWFNLWRKYEFPEKTTDLPQVTDRITPRIHLTMSGIQAYNFNGVRHWLHREL